MQRLMVSFDGRGRGVGDGWAPRLRHGGAVLAGSLATLMLLGCRSSPRSVVLDLTSRFWVADRSSPCEVVFPGTPGAERFLREGFSWELDGTMTASVATDAEVSFSWPTPAARVLLIDLEASPGLTRQGVSVSIGGRDVSRLDVAPGRHRLRVDVPATAQRAGQNRVRLSFAEGMVVRREGTLMEPAAERRVAGRLDGIAACQAADEALAPLALPGAPLVYGVSREGPTPSLAQVGSGTVSFVVALPERAELRFTPALGGDAPPSAAVRLRVTYEARGRPEQTLWSQVLGRGTSSGEVVEPLPGQVGDLVRLSLRVDPMPRQQAATVVWGAPRVLGSHPAPGPQPGPYAPAENGRADDLRRALHGANVLLLILDAARAQQFGCYGYERATTPEIDRLASDGIVFERASTPATFTLGAMSSIWTSQQADAHHRGWRFSLPLPASVPTIAELLSARGVATYGVVANAMAGRAAGLARGFSAFDEVLDQQDQGAPARVLREAAEKWLAASGDRRFFAYLHFREPHFPYQVPPPFDTLFGPNAPLTREQRTQDTWLSSLGPGRVRPTDAEAAHLVRLYDGSLASADSEIGALRRFLERRGLWERTLVIVSGDHGEELLERGRYGHAQLISEQTRHVPLVVRLPSGLHPRGVRLSALADHIDLAPTLADVFGLSPQPPSFEGRSLLPVLAGAPGKSSTLTRTSGERPAYALEEGRYELTYDTRSGDQHLFDLENDRRAQRDLAPAEPILSAYLRQLLHARVALLHLGSAGAPAAQALSREQCENLCSLGYLDCGRCASLP